MNAILADNTMERLPQAGLQSGDAFNFSMLLTSREISALDNSSLANIVGATEVKDRDELLRDARALQLQKLGSYICSFGVKASDSVPEAIDEAEAVIVPELSLEPEVLVEVTPRDSINYDRYLSRLLELDDSSESPDIRIDETDTELGNFKDLIDSLSTLEYLVGGEHDTSSSHVVDFIPDSENLIRDGDAIPLYIVENKDSFEGVSFAEKLVEPEITQTNDNADQLDSAHSSENEPSLESVGRLARLRRSFNALSDTARDAYYCAYEPLVSAKNKLIPSRRTLRNAAFGLAVFGYAHTNISFANPFGEASSQSRAPEKPAQALDALGSLPLGSTPSETTIEVTVDATEAPMPEATVAEETTTSVEATTTTVEPTLYEKVMSGAEDKSELSGNLIAQINIPVLCLNDIDAYGSKTRDSNDIDTLNYFLEKGLLKEWEVAALSRGTASTILETKFHKFFNPIYRVDEAQVSQEACETTAPMDDSTHPPRWGGTLKDLSVAGLETTPLKDIEPVVDIDIAGALPGQEGMVIISGHRTSDSAVFMNLDQLKAGDEIVIKTDDGNAFTYIVELNTEVAYHTIENDYYGYINAYQSPTGATELATLLSCDGEDARVIVRLYKKAA